MTVTWRWCAAVARPTTRRRPPCRRIGVRYEAGALTEALIDFDLLIAPRRGPGLLAALVNTMAA